MADDEAAAIDGADIAANENAANENASPRAPKPDVPQDPETLRQVAEAMIFASAEALSEKVERGELREEDAVRIGRQILRDNALTMFPKLRRWLWRKQNVTVSPVKE